MDFKYAGFWIRSCAFIIDILVVSILTLIILVFLNGIDNALETFIRVFLVFSTNSWISGVLMSFPIMLVLLLFYLIIFPITNLQSTLGMKICGLRIIDGTGNKISFWRSLFRTLIICLITCIMGLIISPISLFVTWILSYGMRGEISSTIPILFSRFVNLTLLAMCLPALFIAFRNNKRALHDFFTKTYVIYISSSDQIPQELNIHSEKIDPNNINYANVWQRIGAFALDFLILVSVFTYKPILAIISPVSACLLSAAYFVVALNQWQGTIAMSIFRIKIINEYGNHISVFQSLVRFLSSCVPFFIIILGFSLFTIFTTPDQISVYYDTKPQISSFTKMIFNYDRILCNSFWG